MYINYKFSTMVTTDDIKEAIQKTKTRINSKKDSFLVLSSLNLLNAAIKLKEHKDLIGYSFIKPTVSRLIEYYVQNRKQNFVDEIYYDITNNCAYLRCFGIQFSFHNINYIDQNIVNLISKRKVEWDAIRLQPIALDLYNLAKEAAQNRTIGEYEIKERFQNILNEKT